MNKQRKIQIEQKFLNKKLIKYFYIATGFEGFILKTIFLYRNNRKIFTNFIKI